MKSLILLNVFLLEMTICGDERRLLADNQISSIRVRVASFRAL